MVEFQPFTEEWLERPYPIYRELREQDPVHWDEGLSHWVLTRYDDVVAVLKDNDHFSAANRPPQRRWNHPTMMVTADPPDHARLRRPATHRFTAGAVNALRPRILEVVDELFDEIEERGDEFDAIWDFARQLPRTIIAEMMGVPLEPRRVSPAVYPARERGAAPPKRTPEMDPVRPASDDFFAQALERHRSELEDDLLQDLIAAESGGTMDAEEVLDTAIILYGAGQETTANMVGNALLTLFRYPDELARLRDGAVDLDAATDELLRFDAPVHTVRRKAIADLEVDGHQIEAGQKVLCLIMAANHDPAVFDDPDGLQLDREDNYHVAFGSGVHTCLGGLLARAETRVAVGRLVERYPKMKLAVPEDEIRRSGSLVIRGVERLPLRLR
jgi:hypothetical protein